MNAVGLLDVLQRSAVGVQTVRLISQKPWKAGGRRILQQGSFLGVVFLLLERSRKMSQVKKANELDIKGTVVRVVKVNDEDYICLTDMLKAKDGEFFVTDWLRNRNTLEFIGIWERIYNPAFNYGEFATIRNQAGLNSFKIGVQEFTARTNAMSLISRTGRYGGTYAHKDIAFEFAMWISAEFKIYIVKEFQRLKAKEQELVGWSAKRELAKINYRIHTDAIQQNLIPATVTRSQMNIIYASEADVLNVALFGMTHQQWQAANPKLKGNQRDYATINQLICISNMENINAVMINDGIPQPQRLKKLKTKSPSSKCASSPKSREESI